MTISIQNETLHLLPEKAIFWPTSKTLFIADLHLGKAAHFRKKGLPVPASVQQTNLGLLQHLIDSFEPNRIFFLGDLFHSRYNDAWVNFAEFIKKHPNISFELILGNHDILSKENYASAQLTVHPEGLEVFPFILSHHPMENIPSNLYNLYGHLHPCVRLQGMGTRSAGVRLPCFHFSLQQAVLPAFGEFTGMSEVSLQSEDRVFVVAENKVIEV